MIVWRWVLLSLANVPVFCLLGALVFASLSAFMTAVLSGIGLGLRMWNADDDPTELIADLKVKAVLVVTIAAVVGEKWLLARHGWW